ncbi:MAG: hypothetical protein ACI9MC_001010, partial [Kiritimatiellia bacterium]
ASSDGGGYYLSDGADQSGVHRGVVFDGNGAGSRGGGFYGGVTPVVTFYGALFDTNDASLGGGVFLQSVSSVNIIDSEIVGNTATNGGGLYYSGGSLNTRGWYLRRTHIHGNSASGSGGGLYIDNGSLYLHDSWLYSNSARGSGGGFYSNRIARMEVRGSLICGNSATTGGGAYMNSSWSYRTFYASVFMDNTSTSQGAALYDREYYASSGYYSYTALTYVTMTGNKSSGSIYDGAFLYNSGSFPNRLTFQYSMITDNDEAGLAYTNGSRTTDIYMSNSVLYNHTKAHVYPSSPYLTTNGNAIVTPKYVSRTLDGNCLNDDLTQKSGYLPRGAGDGPGVYGYLYRDSDGDGWTIHEGDCADSDKSRNPGVKEIAGDGIDQDCTGDDVIDADGDGFAGSGTRWKGTDCDDADKTVHPGATETWYDGDDSDCSGGSDNDQDGDGFDAESEGGEDCDDTDSSVNPDMLDIPFDGVDSDCNGVDADVDVDGFNGAWTDGDGVELYTPDGDEVVDCDDTNSDINPDAEEIWYDDVDQDCDELSDHDQDLDGFDTVVSGGEDCDDLDDNVNPDIEEIWYDGVDGNCDEADDFDKDGDGHRHSEWGGEDCDDEDAARHPDHPEIKDGIDNDCDGTIDPDKDRDDIMDYYEEKYGTNVNHKDSDGDGIWDGVEWGDIEDPDNPWDSDEDGTYDVLDPDSDDDGVPDQLEAGGDGGAPLDSDGDGVFDFRDADDDEDGVPTADELDDGVIRDSDGDGIADYLDTDSDGDGVPDGVEFGADADGDGIPDHLDNGSDGGDEGEPAGVEKYGFGCSTSGTAPFGLAVFLLPLLLVRRRLR